MVMNADVLRQLLSTVTAGVRPKSFRQGAPRPSISPAVVEPMLVLADALEEAGYAIEAGHLRELDYVWRHYERVLMTIGEWRLLKTQIREAISRLARRLPPPESEDALRRRLFRYYRRQGLTPPEAVRYAKRSENLGRIVFFDARDAEDTVEVLHRLKNGSYELERADRLGGQRWQVYRMTLEREPLPSWINAAQVAQYFDMSGPTALRRMWGSRDPKLRAEARSLIGRAYGFRNLDDYPLTMTTRELRLRYRRNITR